MFRLSLVLWVSGQEFGNVLHIFDLFIKKFDIWEYEIGNKINGTVFEHNSSAEVREIIFYFIFLGKEAGIGDNTF